MWPRLSERFAGSSRASAYSGRCGPSSRFSPRVSRAELVRSTELSGSSVAASALWCRIGCPRDALLRAWSLFNGGFGSRPVATPSAESSCCREITDEGDARRAQSPASAGGRDLARGAADVPGSFRGRRSSRSERLSLHLRCSGRHFIGSGAGNSVGSLAFGPRDHFCGAAVRASAPTGSFSIPTVVALMMRCTATSGTHSVRCVRRCSDLLCGRIGEDRSTAETSLEYPGRSLQSRALSTMR